MVFITLWSPPAADVSVVTVTSARQRVLASLMPTAGPGCAGSLQPGKQRVGPSAVGEKLSTADALSSPWKGSQPGEREEQSR